MRRVLVVALALAFSSLALAGCSQAPTTKSREAVSPSSDADANRMYYQCMKEKGWKVTIVGDHTEADFPTVQRDHYLKEAASCTKSSPIKKLSAAQWKTVYGLQVTTSKCLEGLGYSPNPPSFQSFLDQPEEQRWTPFVELLANGQLTPSAMKSVEEKCPQVSFYG